MTFRAATMPQALAKVKREIGTNAVIVHTRTLRQGGFLGVGKRNFVEIIARKGQDVAPKRRRPPQAGRLRRAYNPQTVSETAAPNNSAMNRLKSSYSPTVMVEKPSRLDDELKGEIANIKGLIENLVKEQRQLQSPSMPEKLFDVYLNLIQQEVADELARELIGHVQKELNGSQMENPPLICRKLSEIMETTIETAGPIACNINGSPRTVALIGPTGVGKTTTIAKLAANFKLKQNKKVGLITIDTYRIGAVDQLRMYAQIIDVPLKVVLTPQELREAVAIMNDMDIIFIDTAGRSQNDDIKIKELRTFLKAANPDEVHLVLSTTSRQSHLVNAAEKFKKVGVDRVIFTKLDEAINFGVVFSVLKKIDASLSYVTTGQDVPADIEVGNGSKLAKMLLETKQADTPNGSYAKSIA